MTRTRRHIETSLSREALVALVRAAEAVQDGRGYRQEAYRRGRRLCVALIPEPDQTFKPTG